MSKSIFEKIADRELPSYTIWEDEKHMAFLTIAPIAKAHTLVIPKKNLHDHIFDLTDEDYIELQLAAKKVAKLLQLKTASDRVISWTEGFEVPHVHIHLVPVNKCFQFADAKPQMAEQDNLKAVHASLTD